MSLFTRRRAPLLCTPRPYTVRRSVSQPMCYSQNVCRAELQVASEAEASFAGRIAPISFGRSHTTKDYLPSGLAPGNCGLPTVVDRAVKPPFTAYQMETADRGVSHLTGSIAARTGVVITGLSSDVITAQSSSSKVFAYPNASHRRLRAAPLASVCGLR